MPGYYSSMQDPGQTNPVAASKRSLTEPQSSTQPPKKKTKRSSSKSSLLEPETSTQQEPSEKNKQDYDKWTITDHLMFLWGLEECTGQHRWKAISEQFLPHKPARKITSHNQKFELRLTVSKEKREKTPSMLDVRAIDPSYRDYLHAVRRATLERNSELLHQPDTRTLSSNLQQQQPAINNHTNDNSALSIQYYGDQVPMPDTDSSSLGQQESAYHQQEPHHQATFETWQQCADIFDLDDDQQDVPMQQLDNVYAEFSSLLLNSSGVVGNAANGVFDTQQQQLSHLAEFEMQQPLMEHQPFSPESYPCLNQPHITTNGYHFEDQAYTDNSTYQNQYYYGHQPSVEEPAKVVFDMQQQQPSYRAELETHQPPLEHQPAANPESYRSANFTASQPFMINPQELLMRNFPSLLPTILQDEDNNHDDDAEEVLLSFPFDLWG